MSASFGGSLDASVVDGDDSRAVEFTFAVENVGQSPVDLQFRSGKVADVVVSADGTDVWRWSDGRMFTQVLRTETVAPGDAVVHEMRWDDPPPGEYTATATLEATNVSLSARTDFAVP